MNYEIVTLEEKKIVGLNARTSNADPAMNAVIGGLWQKLFGEGIFASMPDKVSGHSIGLYSDYENGAEGEYDITIGCEVTGAENRPEGTIVKVIPGGRYAKFVIFGDMVEAVCKAWTDIWAMDELDRAYTGDFEEYVDSKEEGDSEIHIYIALK